MPSILKAGKRTIWSSAMSQVRSFREGQLGMIEGVGEGILIRCPPVRRMATARAVAVDSALIGEHTHGSVIMRTGLIVRHVDSEGMWYLEPSDHRPPPGSGKRASTSGSEERVLLASGLA